MMRISAIDRFVYYRNNAGSMKGSLTQAHPCELVWVVDAAVPNAELDWARKHINMSRPPTTAPAAQALGCFDSENKRDSMASPRSRTPQYHRACVTGREDVRMIQVSEVSG